MCLIEWYEFLVHHCSQHCFNHVLYVLIENTDGHDSIPTWYCHPNVWRSASWDMGNPPTSYYLRWTVDDDAVISRKIRPEKWTFWWRCVLKEPPCHFCCVRMGRNVDSGNGSRGAVRGRGGSGRR